MPTANGRKKLRLWNRDPHCEYCGCLTELSNGALQKDNTATLDHVYSKLDGRRHEVFGTPQLYKLACFRCNQERNMGEIHGMGIQLVMEKSGFYYSPDSPIQLNRSI